MTSLADKLLRTITAKSPRLVCTQCNHGFLLASLDVRLTSGGMKDCCPHCGANGPFRAPSEDEAREIYPERKHWWVLAPIGLLVLLVLAVTIWGAVK
jgi:hypothetical protein